MAEASSGGHARTPAKLSLHATPRLALILPRIPTEICLTLPYAHCQPSPRPRLKLPSAVAVAAPAAVDSPLHPPPSTRRPPHPLITYLPTSPASLVDIARPPASPRALLSAAIVAWPDSRSPTQAARRSAAPSLHHQRGLTACVVEFPSTPHCLPACLPLCLSVRPSLLCLATRPTTEHSPDLTSTAHVPPAALKRPPPPLHARIPPTASGPH